MGRKSCTGSVQCVVNGNAPGGGGEGEAHHTAKAEEVYEPRKLQVQLPRSRST